MRMALDLDRDLLDRYLRAVMRRSRLGGPTSLDDAHAELAQLVCLAAQADPAMHDYMRARLNDPED